MPHRLLYLYQDLQVLLEYKQIYSLYSLLFMPLALLSPFWYWLCIESEGSAHCPLLGISTQMVSYSIDFITPSPHLNNNDRLSAAHTDNAKSAAASNSWHLQRKQPLAEKDCHWCGSTVLSCGSYRMEGYRFQHHSMFCMSFHNVT